MELESKKELHMIGSMFYELINRFEGVNNKKHLYKGINDITVIEIKTILVIGGEEAKSMSHIAKKLGVSSGTATVTIDRLIEKSFVERIRDVEDRRQVFIKLSDKGNEVCSYINNLKHKLAENFFGLLSKEERALFLSVLSKLNSNFNLVFDTLCG